MKTDQSQSRIGAAFLVFSMLFGIGIALSLTAQAQSTGDRYTQDRNRDNGDQDRRGRDWDRYGNYGGSADLRRTALTAGYDEGVREGRKDRGSRSELRNLSSYQRATKDYSPRLGDRELYRRYFREAFEDGYNGESYGRDTRNRDDRNRGRDRNDNDRRGRNDDGYGNYGGSFQLRQTALNAGFNEGVKQGRKDRGGRNGNGYQGQSVYQKGTKDYSSGLGDREVYRRYFREAYEHGYEDGYAGY
ncbi:MAG TPA: hypothetical protein VFI24_13275 [Pyrinomonadaceae bacterium]|nr:hypothetical protein [Pyrinomonadaceae bacterium]